jgi:hypothetical protein
MATAEIHPVRQRRWLLAVVALSLPAVLFIPLHQLIVVHYYHDSPPQVSGPTAPDALLLWPTFLAGALGAFLAPGALLVALAGSFRRGVATRTKVLMWGLAALSALACLYILRLPNLMSLVK